MRSLIEINLLENVGRRRGRATGRSGETKEETSLPTPTPRMYLYRVDDMAGVDDAAEVYGSAS